MPIDVIKLAEPLLAEVRGIDISRPLDAAIREAVNQAFLDHCVLVFRDRILKPSEMLAFEAVFGRPLVHVTKRYRHPEFDELIIMTNLNADGEVDEFESRRGLGWHSDMCYLEQPAKATMLHPLELPEIGGDTLFANMYAAYDKLSDETKVRLKGLTALQIYDFATREVVDISGDIAQYKHCVQPVTVTHPVTGRRALYVNPLITARIEDMPDDESRVLLDELFGFADDKSIVYEHEWRLGDVLMWDNWCSCHASTDFPATDRRMLRRCTIKGQPLHE